MSLQESTIDSFWGAPANTLGGRDPLGIQNSSIVVYSNLIPGLTNLTRRVRYNGFYCWLIKAVGLHLFNTTPESVDVLDVQFCYVRRAELLLAYVMVGIPEFGDPNGVSGSLYARRHILDDYLDLAKGADKENGLSNTYWRNPLGVFGQYYVGAMIQLGLICPPGPSRNTYRNTELGEKLAEAYLQNVKEKADLFIDCIVKGFLTKDELSDFRCFSLTSIPNNEEREIYKDLFSKYDTIGTRQSFNRASSISMILKYLDTDGVNCQKNQCSKEFLRYNFEAVINRSFDYSSDIERLWFIYELNELTHTAYEAFHFGILNSLTTDPYPLSRIIETLLLGVDNIAHKEGIKALEDFNCDVHAHDLYNRVFDLMNHSKGAESLFEASRLLFVLYHGLQKSFDSIKDYTIRKQLERPGAAVDLLERFFVGQEYLNLHEFVETMLYDAMNVHMRSSYEKSNATSLTHNYMIEEGSIWRLRNTIPIRTSPRLDSLLAYMEDLGWIETEDNHLRSTGDDYRIRKDGE